MAQRYLGGIITANPTEPSSNDADASASGVWTLEEALSFYRAGDWPNYLNKLPFAAQAIFFLGGNPTSGNPIEYYNIATAGNSKDFGDGVQRHSSPCGAASNATRLLIAGNSSTGPGDRENISYITFATKGDATDFGNLSLGRSSCAGGAGNGRGIFAGGEAASGRNDTIDYKAIASTGNFSDFGNLSGNTMAQISCGSTTRLCIGGGTPSGSNYSNEIQYITISSTGNTTDFGDLTLARSNLASGGSSTRGLFAMGFDGGSGTAVNNVIDYITIASTSNATDFGDSTQSRYLAGGATSPTRATFAGGFAYGNDGGGAAINSSVNTIDAVNIASVGNATDFGDLSIITNAGGGGSNSHGGIA